MCDVHSSVPVHIFPVISTTGITHRKHIGVCGTTQCIACLCYTTIAPTTTTTTPSISPASGSEFAHNHNTDYNPHGISNTHNNPENITQHYPDRQWCDDSWSSSSLSREHGLSPVLFVRAPTLNTFYAFFVDAILCFSSFITLLAAFVSFALHSCIQEEICLKFRWQIKLENGKKNKASM